ncbi:N-acetylmuramoyl-L-alanine amidase family protein [Arcobacter vandammei]|uniref:N-acetylmuramoyl-L-alanine amidase family protein n=1 Tax=Arcobacter vandammei TaxID=2782243 RepID=UPI001D1950C4|nr:N-acetylmuramoyl-L-alanine amidase [Arcobacter vandammei]
MKKDDNQKISDLQKVIDLGKKLKKDTKPDEAKLKILQDKQKDNSKAIVKKEPEKKLNIPTKKTQEIKDNSNIDTENLIKQIYKDNNKIVVKFNKNIDKSYISHKGVISNGTYLYTFEINGKYKYTNPTKISIDGIDKITTTDANQNTIIKIENSTKPKISFMLRADELIILAETDTKIVAQEKKVETKKQDFVEKKPESKIENVVKNEPTKKVEEKNPKQETTTKEPVFINTKTSSKPKNKVIVIDAGHGGSDVGAVGPNKRYEKVINLEVTKYLYSILKQRGYTVYLTRSTDTFIKVMDRTILANEKNADLFISVHTNSMPKEKAASTSGIETFFLSPARSERAKRVAALENKDDIREMNESSKSVFLESLNRPRITASHKFAIDVQAGLLQSARSKYKDVKDTGVKEGPFWVLVGAQMPSILIELGFISHPEESRRLYEKEYQQLLANGIANGIDSYFSKNP